ncbi:unnamed protein product [Rotaria socialis]|uniref:Leucine-rich repeat-containing protein 51 n=2 Tax=Rotaria socialis TaxID=392032 RepID=A0A819Z5W5_9BILA|nr:unnamed protein product [Rotaria socialis]CAF3377962.1 unnamed protein product [Rotaria socialis]CAF3522528.1 unnamed protein product [Rotaria socialis]CAF3730731.1 unnamed protein product [Rotaria socialis]CAF4163731.1 unnamed protein product [Rotaria socialis]
MNSLARLKNSLANIQKRIDDTAEFYPTLDYSFHDAETLEAAVSTRPRVLSGGPQVVKEGNQYYSYGINLNHNKLNGPLETLPKFVREIFINPDALSVIDLSCNQFTEVPMAIKQFISLKHFYFHKNLIVDIREIRKLSSLKQLKFLTLNGNPIEDDIPYLRSYVLCILPGLRNFNRTTISRSDLKISIIWKTTNKDLLSKILKKPTKN